MTNDFTNPKNFWQNNRIWMIILCVLILIGSGIGLLFQQHQSSKTQRENIMAFDAEKWRFQSGSNYPYRNQMLKELVYTDRLRLLNEQQIVEQLGLPDKQSGNFMYYRISQKRIGLMPLNTTTLVIELSRTSKKNKVLIHE